MVYDMQNDAFPYKNDKNKKVSLTNNIHHYAKRCWNSLGNRFCFMLTQQLPLVGLNNVTTFFELSHLGMDTDSNNLYLHGDMVSKNYNSNTY